MKTIFILSMWRSGTSWLEDILGKEVENSALFGHEQQILPLLAMYKEAFNDSSLKVRRDANIPLCDINYKDFHKEFGIKQHKVLINSKKYSNEDFNSFALRLTEFYLYPYVQNNFSQVVEKSPENLSPKSFQIAIDVFQNKKDYCLVYLIRDFRAYLSSCHSKFVSKGKKDLNYYTKKWIEWNCNALKYLSDKNISNLNFIRYEDLVRNPEMIDKFAVVRKQNLKNEVREGTLDKWESSPVINNIQDIYYKNKSEIQEIEHIFTRKAKSI